MRAATLVVSAILTMLIAIPVMATDAVFVALPDIGRTFSAMPGDVQAAMASYIIAYAATQLIYGPLSDRFGRRRVLLAALIIFTAGSALCATAGSLAWLSAARALQGIGAGSGPTLARAILRDRHGAERSIRMLSYVMAAFGLIAVAAPITGGILVDGMGWPAVFALGALYGALCLGLTWLRLDESRPTEWAADHGIARYFLSYGVLLRSRSFMLLAGANTAIYGAMFVWISSAVLVLIDGMGEPANRAGAWYAVSVVGFVVGSALAGRLQARLTSLQVIAGGLVLCLAASASGWAVAGIAAPLAVVVPGFAMMIGIGCVTSPATATGIAPYPEMAGAASALIGFIQMGVATLTVLAAGFLYDGTARPMMILMAVLSALGIVLFAPFLDRLRQPMIAR